MTEQTTTKKLAEEITTDAGIDPKEIPHVGCFIDPIKQVWKLGEPSPIKKELIIFSMFRSGDDVLVYCVPLKEKDEKNDLVPFTRYTLSRHSPSLLVESMYPDTFKALMAAELVNVFEDTVETLGEETEEPNAPQPNGEQSATPPPGE